MKNKTAIYGGIAVLLILGFTARLLPHPANVAPIGALALFGGMYLSRRSAIAILFGSMILSDLVIGTYNWKIIVAVYGSFFLAILLGQWVKKNKTFARTVSATLLGSITFFLVTNAAVWAFGTMYPHSIAGLLESYTMAIPFFRNSLLGDIFFVTILVGSMETILHYSKQKQTLEQTI